MKNSLAEFIEMNTLKKKTKVPDTIIEAYVEGIQYDKGVFTWVLNPKLGNEVSNIEIDTKKLKKNELFRDKINSTYYDCCSTGCYRK